MCSWFEPGGSAIVYCELDRSESTYLLEESASPFIDEGDGFTSERERVCMLLSLAAHANGYKIMVGAHNTV